MRQIALTLLLATFLLWTYGARPAAGDPPPPPKGGPPPTPPAAVKRRPPSKSRAPETRTPETRPFPVLIGAAVGPQNHAHWPVRVRSLDKIHWTFDEGRHVGMALPLNDDLLAIQAGGGGIRGVQATTGKRVWYSPGATRYWNYSTCIAGPGGVTYGGNYGWIQAVDRSGKRLWRTDLQARWVHRPPALSPDGKTLYIAADGVGLASLNAANGLINWLRRDFGSPWNIYCFDAEGRLIVTTRAGTSCYASNGKELWRLPKPLANLMVVGESLLGTRDRTLVALDVATQRLVWSWQAGASITGLALGDDGRVAVSQNDGQLTSVDLQGRQRWRRKLSTQPLHAPSTAKGGEVLVLDGKGLLFLLGSGGRLVSALDTGGTPYRWRPTVGPDGRVYVGQAQRIVCVGGAERPPPKPTTATELTIVADDFVVDIWVNGKRLPLTSREKLSERHGAMTERVFVDLKEGDWIVFNVVANRLRWNGASYFGVHARGPEGEMAFVSSTKGGWSYCDKVSDVAAFIAQREAGRDRPAVAPTNPWQDAPQIWKDVLSRPFSGTPVWGKAPLTWIKYVVGPPGGAAPRSPEASTRPALGSMKTGPDLEGSSRHYWLARMERLEPGMTPAQAQKGIPPWGGGGVGGVGTGSSQVLIYAVSARWIVQLTFLHEGGLTGTPMLLDAAGDLGGDQTLCLVTERADQQGWKTLGEILVSKDGGYLWTRYTFPTNEARPPLTRSGRLPSTLLEQLKVTFDGPNRHHQVWLFDSKVRHPESITRLRQYLAAAHRDETETDTAR